jgi:hypothetical protein
MLTLKTKNYKGIHIVATIIFLILFFQGTMNNSKSTIISTFVKKNNLGQFIDLNGNALFNQQYKSAAPFRDGLSWVLQNDTFKVININGSTEFSIDPNYTIIYPFAHLKNGMLSFYSCAYPLMLPSHCTNPQYYYEIQKGFVYLIDLKTKKELKLKDYIYSGPYQEGLIAVGTKDKHTVLNLTLKPEKAKYGFIDKNGIVKIKLTYDDVQDFSEGLCAVKVDKFWKYINSSNQTIVNGKFDYAENFHENVAIVSEGKKFGLINKEGKYIIPPTYNFIEYIGNGKLNVYTKSKPGYFNERYYSTEGQCALFNINGAQISSFIFQKFIPVTDFTLIAKINSKIYLTDYKGNIQKELEVDDFISTSHDRIVVVKNNLKGIMDKEGQWILPAEYDYISIYSN